MKPFDYYRVTSVEQAVSLLGKHQGKAAVIAGGSDLLGLMKDRVEGAKLKAPQHLIDIKGIKDLGSIKEHKGGLRIGAAATITEILESDLVRKKYPLLSQAAKQVAVPQIRNVGTLGGNLCQRPRCWYFRGRLFGDCFRKGGGTCYAQSGESQYHAIVGGDICAMVCPSDMATALTSLNAKVELAGPKGTRQVALPQFYVAPEKNILAETALSPQEMVVAVDIPAPLHGASGVFLKLKERQAFDFALVSVAVNLALSGTAVNDGRIVFGGVACAPLRSTKAESAMKGKGLKEGAALACAAAIEGARPLKNNAYKVQAARGVLEQALSSLV